MNAYKQSVVDYFKKKSEEYDLVDNQKYWVLSDEILWYILKEHILNQLVGDFSFVDAGGGTGRWSLKILEGYKKSTGLIIDLSEDMLRQAKKKTMERNLNLRLKFEQADLDNYQIKEDSSNYDLAFSFHNVLGFVKSPESVIDTMYKMVKKNGYIVSLVPNLYHNIYFNISNNNLDLANEALETNRGRFTIDMPSMNMFTPNKLREIYNQIGIRIEGVYGFPNMIYPGMMETQLQGHTQHLQNILEDNKNFEKIKNIELNLYQNIDSVGRGNQLIIIGKKK